MSCKREQTTVDAGALRLTCPAVRLRRRLLAGVVAATVALAAGAVLTLVDPGAVGPLQAVSLLLFLVLFAWIALAFWSAFIGFVLGLSGRDPLSLRRRVPGTPGTADPPLVSRTALVMPVHNEDPQRVVHGLAATCESVIATGQGAAFDAFVLSDTMDADIAEREQAAVAELRQRLPRDFSVHYRRRPDNTGRKAGNIADFCRRWGGRYDFMVVLDADSLMAGSTLVTLARTMEANPGAGLIQTVPVPVRQQTLFGRLFQFAGAVHSRMLAAGMAFWQGDAANYWGHNAILRLRAFTAHCGLPTLPGSPPLGGEILSHDFVEAALMRRAGWGVWVLSDLQGSYEELPTTLLDYAKRDRRWIQGNLQHLRLLGNHDLHPLSRLHLFLGAFTYLASPLWLALLALTSIDAVLRSGGGLLAVAGEGAGGVGSATALALLIVTVLLVLAPRVFGLVLIVTQAGAGSGRVRLAASGVLDVVFSVLIAPVLLVLHAWFLVCILSGRATVWRAQARQGRLLSWRQAWGYTGALPVLALVWGGLLVWQAPALLVWLLPVLLPLLVAPVMTRFTSSDALGGSLASAGFLRAPDEPAAVAVLARLCAHERAPLRLSRVPANHPTVPPETPEPMPVQALSALALPFAPR